jgi:hypothetical protein
MRKLASVRGMTFIGQRPQGAAADVVHVAFAHHDDRLAAGRRKFLK